MDTKTGHIYADEEVAVATARGKQVAQITEDEERVLRAIPEERRLEALQMIRALGGVDQVRRLSEKDAAEIDAKIRGMKTRRAEQAQREALAADKPAPHPLARVNGESDEDHRANRNALKRARPARRNGK